MFWELYVIFSYFFNFFLERFFFFWKFSLPFAKLLLFSKTFCKILVLFKVYSFITCGFLPNFTACWLYSWSLSFVLKKKKILTHLWLYHSAKLMTSGTIK
jgi:hypothetical protein